MKISLKNLAAIIYVICLISLIIIYWSNDSLTLMQFVKGNPLPVIGYLISNVIYQILNKIEKENLRNRKKYLTKK